MATDCCVSATTADYDLTGQILWPAARLLADYLAAHLQLLEGRRGACELGAGARPRGPHRQPGVLGGASSTWLLRAPECSATDVSHSVVTVKKYLHALHVAASMQGCRQCYNIQTTCIMRCTALPGGADGPQRGGAVGAGAQRRPQPQRHEPRWGACAFVTGAGIGRVRIEAVCT